MPARANRTAAPAKPSPRRGDGDPIDQFAAIVWIGTDVSTLRKLWFDSPVDALTAAVEYLKAGYQARLSDGAVAHFAALPRTVDVALPGDPPAPARFSSTGRGPG